MILNMGELVQQCKNINILGIKKRLPFIKKNGKEGMLAQIFSGIDMKSVSGLLDTEERAIFAGEIEGLVSVESLPADPMYAEVTLGPEDDIKPFLREIGFSDQAVIVRPEGRMFPIFRGLNNEQAVQFAIRDCLRFSDSNRVFVATDHHASCTSKRRKENKSKASGR